MNYDQAWENCILEGEKLAAKTAKEGTLEFQEIAFRYAQEAYSKQIAEPRLLSKP